MKKSFFRIVSLLLTLASLVSMLTVFAWAEEDDTDLIPDEEVGDEVVEEEDLSEMELFYERDYQEGWEVNNGFTVAAEGHNFFVDYEELSDYSYNYFARFEATNSAKEGKVTLNFGARVAQKKSTIISLRIKADDAANFSSSIMYMTTGGKVAKDLLFISNKNLYAFSMDKDNHIADLSNNGWVDVTIVLDWSDRTQFVARAYVGEEYLLEEPAATVTQSNGTMADGSAKVDSGVYQLFTRIPAAGSEANAKKQDGMSFCIDDLQIYQGVVNPVDKETVQSMGPGLNIDPLVPKTVDIKTGSGEKTVDQLLEEALCLKLDVPYALFRNEKTSLADYCTPTRLANGEIVVSLGLILDFIGYPYYPHPDGQSFDITTGLSSTYITVGRDTASVDGELVELTLAPGYLEGTDDLVIAMADIPALFSGWLLTYDDMGLIIMYEDTNDGNGEELISREKDLDTMLAMMKRFVFDTVTTDAQGNELTGADAYIENGKVIYEDVKVNTNNFQHPYIYATQSEFDAIKAAYEAAADDRFNSYVDAILGTAKKYYDDAADIADDGAYVGIAEGKAPVNVYYDGLRPTGPKDETVNDTENAYSPNGDLFEIEALTEKLVYLAFAYQVTGDENYAKLAYDMSLVFGEWLHWAPGYMVNCATATANFAVSYDWLYNAYLALYGEDGVAALADIIYNKGLIHGYNASAGIACEFARPSGTGDHYTTRTDSWNAVCASGMIIGSLAIMENEQYRETTDYLIGNNIQNLVEYGLDQYAPDGSYIESTTYWAIGTNGLMKLIMALDSAAGKDYGLKDTWGINSTFYFAIHIENSDGEDWNYHEDGVGSVVDGTAIGVDTQMFNFAASLFGDEKLYVIREEQIENGKQVSIFDIFYYSDDFDRSNDFLALDYKMEGIDAFVSRSDWENGALYVGIMGGANNYSPYTTKGTGDDQFGQLDSGNWVYANNGTTWFMDLGSDNYGAYNYFGSYRYRYYRNSAEGNNVLFFTSKQGTLPWGQDPNGSGELVKTVLAENGDGSSAIIDNSGIYSSYVLSAKRGMLLFNDRSTVVIQDEVSMNTSFEDVCWVAHTAHEIVLDASGRTAYLINKDSNGFVINTLRATLVADSSALKFEVSDASTTILKDTIKQDNSEISREGIQKLVIRANGVLGFNVAVVLEEVENENDTKPVAYNDFVDMARWDDLFYAENGDDGLVRRGKAVRADIINETVVAEMFYDNDTAFADSFQDFYTSLTTVAYTLKTFSPDTFGPTELYLLEAYDDYLDYVEECDAYADYVNDSMDNVLTTLNLFMGIK